jgi:ankyrin repeat protein
MLELLIDRGSPVDVRSDEGATPLMNAAQDRSPEKATRLLDRGANPNAADNRGFTPLHRAAEMGHIDVVRLLLDRGANPEVEAQGHTPKSLATMRNETEIVALLSRH